ncbi:hypothetical protein ABTE52_22680, partial [Acinetobacter baumannii]
NQPKGTVDGARQAFTVYTNDPLLKAEQWNDMVLAGRNGAPIRVKDIGIAIDGPENNKIAAWAFAGAANTADHTISNGR